MGQPELPFEIISDILSWMPVKSLLRFKCVRKQWPLLIEDCKFVAKHFDRSTSLKLSSKYIRLPNERVERLVLDKHFIYIASCVGLLLEKSRSTPQAFRIRNPATRQVLYLPDAPGDNPSMNLVFNSATGECKVAYNDFEQEGEGFRIMAIGKEEHWRFLKAPNQNDNVELISRCTFRPNNVEGTAHIVDIISDGQDSCVEVQSFDVWSECFTINTVPRGVFKDLTNVYSFPWHGHIAVADIVEEALNVLILEDFRQHKWSQSKIVVPLKFLKDKPHLKGQIRPGWGGTYKNGVKYIDLCDLEVEAGWKYILSCDMKGEIVKEATPKKTDGTKYSFALEKPSLIAVKGMKPL